MDLEKIYDAFAELIYAVVIADGKITQEEKDTISKVIQEHTIKLDIQKHFNSELKNLSVAQTFLKTFEICRNSGDNPEYSFLIKIVEDVSKVSEGLNRSEDNLLQEFILSFKKKFLPG